MLRISVILMPMNPVDTDDIDELEHVTPQNILAELLSMKLMNVSIMNLRYD